VPDHRPVAIIDLAFFAGRRGDDDVRVGRAAAAQGGDKSADTRIARRKVMPIDELLPDGHRVAATRQRLGNQLVVWLAGARTRRAPGPDGARSVDTVSKMAGFDDAASLETAEEMAGLAGSRSVDTSGGEMAGFGFASLGRPGPRTAIAAAFR
jgi:hypothetical protein